MNQPRFETDFGNVEGQFTPQLKSFVAYYRFQGRTWSIRVWAKSWAEAEAHCRQHGLQLTGQLIDEIE